MCNFNKKSDSAMLRSGAPCPGRFQYVGKGGTVLRFATILYAIPFLLHILLVDSERIMIGAVPLF